MAVVVVVVVVTVQVVYQRNDQASLSKTSRLFVYSESTKKIQEIECRKYLTRWEPPGLLYYYAARLSFVASASRHTVIMAIAGQKVAPGASTVGPLCVLGVEPANGLVQHSPQGRAAKSRGAKGFSCRQPPPPAEAMPPRRQRNKRCCTLNE